MVLHDHPPSVRGALKDLNTPHSVQQRRIQYEARRRGAWTNPDNLCAHHPIGGIVTDHATNERWRALLIAAQLNNVRFKRS